jgi:hypothetical protein
MRQAGSEDQGFFGLIIMRVQPSSQSFALCVEDGGMEDLEARKLYQILPDVLDVDNDENWLTG